MKAWSAHSHEMYTAVLCVLVGIPLVVGITPSPNSVQNILPTWALVVWGITLTLGGLCTVTGILWRYFQPLQFVRGLLIEKAGQYMLGASCSVLCLAISLYTGPGGLLIAGTYGAFALACISRTRTINKEVKVVKEHGEG